MRRILWHWLISAGALWLTLVALSGGIHVHNGWNVLWIAPLLGLVNAVVGMISWVIKVIALPVNLLTLGCFGFVLSFILYTVSVYGLFKEQGALAGAMTVDGFWWAVALSIVMALFSSVLNMVLPGKSQRD
jgi:putative membrane protein